MRNHGMNLIELLIVIVVLTMLASLVLPALGGKRSSRSMQNNTQLRGIHQSMVMYAQGNGGYFPGLNADGTDGDLSVENRFEILLKNNYFTGEYAISPMEHRTAWTTGPVITAHYSYAMLQVPPSGQRRVEWSETLNNQAIAASDRNTGAPGAPTSVYSGTAVPNNRFGCTHRRYPNTWVGSVVYNDNHVVFGQTHEPDTVYGTGKAAVLNKLDHLFDSTGDHDALLVHSGN